MRPIPKYIAFLLVIIGFYACASTVLPTVALMMKLPQVHSCHSGAECNQ